MYSRLEEIISKFENGEERYNTDPMVHNIVNMIYNNEDPLIIIDSLIKNPVFIAIMGSLIFIIILYIGKLVLNIISGENIELPEFVSKLGSKSKSTTN